MTLGRSENIWLPPDDALVEASAGGERLVARIRLGYYTALLMVPALTIISMRTAPVEVWVSFGVACISVLLSLGVLLAIRRGVVIPGIAFWTTSYDLLALTGLHVLIALSGRPEVTVNSQVVWGVYLLLIVLTTIRFDLRVCVFAGFMSALAYSAVVFWVATAWDLNALGSGDRLYAGFSWNTQLGRVVLMVVATALSAGLIIRSRGLVYVSGTDRLTGIGNRAYFDERLSAELSRIDRQGGILSMAFLDLDHFKRFNDKWGHATGDAALCSVAKILTKESRKEDIIVRWGGEEFVLVMPGTGTAAAVKHLERIRASLKQERLAGADGSGTMTLSGGVAEYPADAKQAADLVALSDRRMLQAKERGRDRIVAE